jgi:hypothetical protein
LLDKHKETVPLAELIEAMNIGKNELISFKIAINEAAQTYGLTPSTAALHVILGRSVEIWGAESGLDRLVVIKTGN